MRRALGIVRRDIAGVAAETVAAGIRALARVHRIGGTALGLVLFTGLYAVEPRAWVLVLILMALQFAIETFVARNYG
uniref:FUSC family protein n=1 Tax=Nocardia carnea TaxID=37328 RepID=UPI00245548F5